MRRSTVFAAAGALAALLGAAPSVQACAVCFGDKNDPLVQGAASGVMLMIGVTYALLLGFVAIGATWFVRARRLQARSASASGSPPRDVREA